jgi:aminoglycoside phosphotransferase (APT) family kinase protein
VTVPSVREAAGPATTAPDAGGPLRPGDAGLAAWLEQHCGLGLAAVRIADVTRVAGGASYETWFLDLVGEGARPQRVVLRREPRTGPLEPYDIAVEAAALRALEPTDVPTPRLLGHCADAAVLGRPFTVLEYVPGEIPDYRDVDARDDWQDGSVRSQMTDDFVSALAALQRVDWRATALPDVLDLPVDEPERIARSVAEMTATVARRTDGWARHPIFRDAGRWLVRHAPAGALDQMVLVHGDYRIGNFVWRDGRIAAFLDWEGLLVGDPLQDLGYACHPIMRERRPELMAMLAPIDDLVERFERATGRTVDRRRLHFYVIYALFCHTWALLLILASVVTPDGDARVITTYAKLNQVTRHLTAQIEAYEDGRGVL